MIRAGTVRVIDSEGNQIGVFSLSEALDLARERNLDLVEISPNADPPVCKIIDYGKFKYEREKRIKEAKKKQHLSHLKEITTGSKTEEHDYKFKLNHIKNFLEKGDKVKITIKFKGREKSHPEFGEKLMNRLLEDTKDIAIVEQKPKMDGKVLFAIIAPKPKQ